MRVDVFTIFPEYLAGPLGTSLLASTLVGSCGGTTTTDTPNVGDPGSPVANAFCAWLTEKERREGVLEPDQLYRLPTDAEWSWAVGIGDQERGYTPQEKSGKLKGTEFILDKFLPLHGPAAVIGSNDFKSDIALPDPDMAPQHARLKGAGTHFMIEDMSIGKGTFVNGRKVEMARLTNNSTIRVGNTELVYHERH